jgi:hypothetical protein
MRHQFPLFQSHLDLAHHYWKQLLQNGGWAIDATCGGGHDTLLLAGLLLNKANSGVIAIDIQEEAISRTRELLPPTHLTNVHLFQQSHADFPSLATTVPIKLIVYNLGYLPRGNKQLTTQTSITLQSVQNALPLLTPGGAISITCYPGHPEGAIEEKALLEMATQLPPTHWNVCHHTFPNRNAAPSLLLIQSQVI